MRGRGKKESLGSGKQGRWRRMAGGVEGLLQALGCDDGSRKNSPGFGRLFQAARGVGLGRALFMQQVSMNTYEYQVLSEVLGHSCDQADKIPALMDLPF